MKVSYKKLTATGDATAKEGCLYGYCLVSDAIGAGIVTIKDGATEILYDTTSAASTSKTVFFSEPIQFTTKIAITAGANFAYITFFYTTA